MTCYLWPFPMLHLTLMDKAKNATCSCIVGCSIHALAAGVTGQTVQQRGLPWLQVIKQRSQGNPCDGCCLSPQCLPAELLAFALHFNKQRASHQMKPAHGAITDVNETCLSKHQIWFIVIVSDGVVMLAAGDLWHDSLARSPHQAIYG